MRPKIYSPELHTERLNRTDVRMVSERKDTVGREAHLSRARTPLLGNICRIFLPNVHSFGSVTKFKV